MGVQWALANIGSLRFSAAPFYIWFGAMFAVLTGWLFWSGLPRSYPVYALLGWALAVFTVAGTGSLTRYVGVVFPCFMALGQIGQRWRWVVWILLPVFLALLVQFSMHFAQWHWVG